MSKTVTILGSTGSIGTQAIDVIQRNPGQFDVTALAAGGNDPAVLAQQAVELGVSAVAVADPSQVAALTDALATQRRAGKENGRGRSGDWQTGDGGQPIAGGGQIEVLAGPDAATELAGRGADVVLNGITGSVGLRPTLAALRAGSSVALANKESLVVGGALVKAAQQRPDQIVPVDSEHSAIAQCLRSGAKSEVKRLILTASGGPFRGRTRVELADVTPTQALAHPTWSMGPVVTINSATLMNKGLELIEAHLLFDIAPEDIRVVVHPQSVVHSMVEFVDGSTIAQASPPDMRLPIALGLSWPQRLPEAAAPVDWSKAQTWTFEPLDQAAFPAVVLARAALAASATHPAAFNAANEQAVQAFLAGRIGFTDIVDTVTRVVEEHDGAATAPTIEEVEAAETWARHRADELVHAHRTLRKRSGSAPGTAVG